jgi:predicted alpha/beta hydrolase family esterase
MEPDAEPHTGASDSPVGVTDTAAPTPADQSQVAVKPFPLRAVLIPDSLVPQTVRNFDVGQAVEDLWYHDAAEVLRNFGIPTYLDAFPDSEGAAADTWCQHVVNRLKLDEGTLVIAHSTGTACLQRVLSDHDVSISGAFLVAPFDAEFHENVLTKDGYFATPVDYDAVMRKAGWIHIVASADDPYLPPDVPMRLARAVGAEYQQFESANHFDNREQEDLLAALKKVLTRQYGLPRQRPTFDGIPVASPRGFDGSTESKATPKKAAQASRSHGPAVSPLVVMMPKARTPGAPTGGPLDDVGVFVDEDPQPANGHHRKNGQKSVSGGCMPHCVVA